MSLRISVLIASSVLSLGSSQGSSVTLSLSLSEHASSQSEFPIGCIVFQASYVLGVRRETVWALSRVTRHLEVFAHSGHTSRLEEARLARTRHTEIMGESGLSD